MIEGFEEYADHIKLPDDIETINAITASLATRIGKDRAITNKKMREKLKVWGANVGDVKMRDIIHYIRIKNLVPRLCAGSKGYWVAATQDEWAKYRRGYKQRVNSMKYVDLAMDFYEQQEKLITT